MSKMCVLWKACVLLFVWHTCTVQAHHLDRQPAPWLTPNACSNHFEIIKEGDQFIGKITLYNSSMDTTHIKVEGSWPGSVPWKHFGRILLFDDRHTTVSNIKQGKPVSYRVEFPHPTKLPKITRIMVNDKDVCVADDYPLPKTMFKLKYMWPPAVSILTHSEDDENEVQIVEISNLDAHEASLYYMFPLVAAEQSKQETPNNLNKECGVLNGQIHTESTPSHHNDNVANGNMFPWLIAIYMKQATGLKFICAGSLISTHSILAPAHCFDGVEPDQIVVRLGRYNLQNYSEIGNIVREVRGVIKHPEYNINAFSDADIAILQMNTPVNFSDKVRPICLWNDGLDATTDNKEAYIVGWGSNDGRLMALPKLEHTNLVSDIYCLLSTETQRTITPRIVCASYRNTTHLCMGDTGSGLMMNENNKWTLRGVISGGQSKHSDCNKKQYMPYCDMTKFTAWVRENYMP